MCRVSGSYTIGSGRLVGVVIVDSSSLIDARIRAAGEIDLQAEFAEGHQIETAVAGLVPAKDIGRKLSSEEAHELLDDLERGIIPKMPAAPSVKQRVVERA